MLVPTILVQVERLPTCTKSVARGSSQMDEFGRMFDPSWAALEARLAAEVRAALDIGYWARHGDAFILSPQTPANMQARPPCTRRADSALRSRPGGPNFQIGKNPLAAESGRRRKHKHWQCTLQPQ